MHRNTGSANGILTLSRRQVVAGAGGLALLPAVAGMAHAGSNRTPPGTLPTGSVRDFDFFVGDWQTTNRRLKKRWVGSNDWEVFPNTIHCESHMGGIVNTDECDFTTQGWKGMTIRTF